MRVFEELAAGARAHGLAVQAYRETASFPAEERFGLTSQIRRAAYSVPANIAEGCGRHTEADFARFLDMALGSASELEYLCLLARDLGYLASDACARLREETLVVKRMLWGLMKAVRNIR